MIITSPGGRARPTTRGGLTSAQACSLAPLVVFFAIYTLEALEGSARRRVTSSHAGSGGAAAAGAAAAARAACAAAAAPLAVPTPRVSFVLPPVPIGARAWDAPPLPDWRDTGALFLDDRVKPGGRFFAAPSGGAGASSSAKVGGVTSPTASSTLFDQDLVAQMLSMYGWMHEFQRPQRSLSEWPATGEMKDRRHTMPFITGDTFRALADFWCDTEAECEKLPKVMSNPAHPVWARLAPEQSVIVFTTCMDQHTLLDSGVLDAGNHTIVIVVHNGDMALDVSLHHYLDHPKLRAYFTQNCAFLDGPLNLKVVCVPIGLENRQFSMHGWTPEVLMGSMAGATRWHSPLDRLVAADSPGGTRRFAFAAWSVGTFLEERAPLQDMIERGGAHHATHVPNEPEPLVDPRKPPKPTDYPPGPFSFVTIGGGGQLQHYHRHILNHAIVIAPRGNGLDTLRAWEAMYLGRIVVTKNSTMDPVWADFPVAIVHEWSELTEEFARATVERFSSPEGRAKLSTTKLFVFYWACELGRAASRHEEFCSIDALRETLTRDNFT